MSREQDALKPYTICVIGAKDVGRFDLEERDVSHWFEKVCVVRDFETSLVTMDATMEKSAPVDPLRHVLRVRAGAATWDFAIVFTQWDDGEGVFRLICYEAKEYWRRQMDSEHLGCIA